MDARIISRKWGEVILRLSSVGGVGAEWGEGRPEDSERVAVLAFVARTGCAFRRLPFYGL